MIKEILGGFRCAEDLWVEIGGLARSTSAVDKALAVGLLGAFWRPSRIEDAVRAMIDPDKSPVGAAQAWAKGLAEAALAEVEAERKALADGLALDLVHLLSTDEEEWNETERGHVRATERRLRALGFVIDAAVADPLGETTCLAKTG